MGAERSRPELGHCGDEELASLIAGARALLMPSLAEGFGLPVVEALQLGRQWWQATCPYSVNSPNIPTYVDVLDGKRWEQTIVSFIGDTPERQRQQQAMKNYRPPEWQAHFTSWMNG